MQNNTLEKINDIDINILRFINRDISNKTLDLTLTPLTNKYKFHYLMEIAGLYLYSKLTNKPDKFKVLMQAFSEVFIASVIFKFIVKHKRPFVTHKDIINRDEDIPNVGSEEYRMHNEMILNNRNSWYSFPSTEAATSIVLLKLLLKPKNNLLNILLINYFSLILFSRMYNGVHRPVDIISGSLLGWHWPTKKS